MFPTYRGSEMLHLPLQSKEQFRALSESQIDETRKRLLERTLPFHQSSMHVNVRYAELENDTQTKWAIRYLLFRDWFDYMVSLRTSTVVFLIILVYSIQLMLWAGWYMAISCSESDPPLNFHEAFAFSLETSTTVGYTLVRDTNDMFFGGCANWIVAIYFQSMISMLLNGFVLGVVMMRIQRANRRSRQIVFSDKACIICVRGRFYLTFQVFDLQATSPIIGVTVRLLAVFPQPSERSPAFFQTRTMRITRPDDELGAKLWLGVPAVVLHEIDLWSPLAPLTLTGPLKIPEAAAPTQFPQPNQRAVDGRIGSRAQGTCFICGASFSTEGGLRRHFEFMSQEEKGKGLAETFGHQGIDPRDISHPVIMRNEHPGDSHSAENFNCISATAVRDDIRERLISRKIEIIVIVEGLDPHTSNLMQARHSYTIDDIEFDKQHAPCMVTGPSGEPRVDLSKFHKLFSHPVVNVEHPIPFASHT